MFEAALRSKSFKTFYLPPSLDTTDEAVQRHQAYFGEVDPDQLYLYRRDLPTIQLSETLRMRVIDTTPCEHLFMCDGYDMAEHPLFRVLYVWLATIHTVNMFSNKTNESMTWWYVTLLPDKWRKRFRKDLIEVIRRTNHRLPIERKAEA